MTTTSVHGHEVIELISTSAQPMTRDEVRAAVEQLYGADASFHACAGGGMSLDDLFIFLLQRGKIAETEDGRFVGGHSPMCDHDH